MRRRALVPAVVVLALVAGGGVAWAWDTRAEAAAAGRDRVAAALAAVRYDERQVSRLASRSADLVGRDLHDGARDALAGLLPAAADTLDATAGEVTDEAVRVRLATALDAARAGLSDTVAPASSGALADELAAATVAASQAHDEWLAAQKAAEEAAAAEAASEAVARQRAAGTPGAPTEGCTVPAQPPFFTSVPSETGDGSNGNLPRSAMAQLSWATDRNGSGFWLVTGAAEALERLDADFLAAFGRHLDLDLTYRDYCTQVAMAQYYGYPRAARPGTSNHGWGAAIDVPEWPDQYGYGTAMHTWLAEHGPAYGWFEQPPGGEYWHFDYRG